MKALYQINLNARILIIILLIAIPAVCLAYVTIKKDKHKTTYDFRDYNHICCYDNYDITHK